MAMRQKIVQLIGKNQLLGPHALFVNSALRIDQGSGAERWRPARSPWLAAIRTKAICLGSGDHSGDESVSTLGSMKRRLLPASPYTPMKAWSPRSLTKARDAPSGDQVRAAQRPRADVKSPSAALEECAGALFP